LARRLAQALNCTGSEFPCGACRSCDQIARGQHPDVVTLSPEGNSIKIEIVREVQSSLALRPVEARWRIAIILDAHRLTGAAADATLKTLEEPPATARLILTASATEAVLPTIVSRCQTIALRPVPITTIQTMLETHNGLSPDQAELIARLSGGRPGWALRAAAEAKGEPNAEPLLLTRSEMLSALNGALHANRAGRFEYAESVAARADAIPQVLDLWRSWWRDVVLIANGGEASNHIVHTDQWDSLSEIAQRVGRYGASYALQAVCKTAEQLERTNVSARLALEVMLLKMPFLSN
jgi:DNA polymerase-3 subunit delta'